MTSGKSVCPILGIDAVRRLGTACAKKLNAIGITISELIVMPDGGTRGLLSVSRLRTVRELRGTSCPLMGFAPPRRKSLAVDASVGGVHKKKSTLLAALAYSLAANA